MKQSKVYSILQLRLSDIAAYAQRKDEGFYLGQGGLKAICSNMVQNVSSSISLDAIAMEAAITIPYSAILRQIYLINNDIDGKKKKSSENVNTDEQKQDKKNDREETAEELLLKAQEGPGEKYNNDYFLKDIIYIDLDGNTSDLLEDIILNGLTIHFETEEVEFVLFERSASQQRQNVLVLISKKFYDQKDLSDDKNDNQDSQTSLSIRMRCGLPRKPMVIASKYAAYRALMLTQGVCVDAEILNKLSEKSIIVVDDYSIVKWKGMQKKYTKYEEEDIPFDPVAYETVDKKADKDSGILNLSNFMRNTTSDKYKEDVLFDGEGIISAELGKLIADDIRDDKVDDSQPSAASFQIRMPFVKGVVHTVDFHSIFRDVFGDDYDNIQIRDHFKKYHSINKVEMILTKSMFKMAGAYKAYVEELSKKENPKYEANEVFKYYWDSFKAGDHRLFISGSDEMFRTLPYTVTNYQFLSTLDEDTNSDIKVNEELIAPSVNALYTSENNTLSKAVSFMVRSRVFDDDNEQETPENTTGSGSDEQVGSVKKNRKDISELLIKNPGLAATPVFKEKIDNKSTLPDEFAKGRLIMNGTMRYLSGDLMQFVTALMKNCARASVGKNGLSESNRKRWNKIIGGYYGEAMGFKNKYYAPQAPEPYKFIENSDGTIREFREGDDEKDAKKYAVIDRNPHLSKNEHVVLSPYEHSESDTNEKLFMDSNEGKGMSRREKYFGHLRGVLMLPVDEKRYVQRLGGADFDGDIVRLFTAPAYVKAAYSSKETLPLVIPSERADETEYTIAECKRLVKRAAGGRVGQFSNEAFKTSLFAYLHRYGEKIILSDEQVKLIAEAMEVEKANIYAAKKRGSFINSEIQAVENSISKVMEEGYFLRKHLSAALNVVNSSGNFKSIEQYKKSVINEYKKAAAINKMPSAEQSAIVYGIDSFAVDTVNQELKDHAKAQAFVDFVKDRVYAVVDPQYDDIIEKAEECCNERSLKNNRLKKTKKSVLDECAFDEMKALFSDKQRVGVLNVNAIIDRVEKTVKLALTDDVKNKLSSDIENSSLFSSVENEVDLKDHFDCEFSDLLNKTNRKKFIKAVFDVLISEALGCIVDNNKVKDFSEKVFKAYLKKVELENSYNIDKDKFKLSFKGNVLTSFDEDSTFSDIIKNALSNDVTDAVPDNDMLMKMENELMKLCPDFGKSELDETEKDRITEEMLNYFTYLLDAKKSSKVYVEQKDFVLAMMQTIRSVVPIEDENCKADTYYDFIFDALIKSSTQMLFFNEKSTKKVFNAAVNEKIVDYVSAVIVSPNALDTIVDNAVGKYKLIVDKCDKTFIFPEESSYKEILKNFLKSYRFGNGTVQDELKLLKEKLCRAIAAELAREDLIKLACMVGLEIDSVKTGLKLSYESDSFTVSKYAKAVESKTKSKKEKDKLRIRSFLNMKNKLKGKDQNSDEKLEAPIFTPIDEGDGSYSLVEQLPYIFNPGQIEPMETVELKNSHLKDDGTVSDDYSWVEIGRSANWNISDISVKNSAKDDAASDADDKDKSDNEGNSEKKTSKNQKSVSKRREKISNYKLSDRYLYELVEKKQSGQLRVNKLFWKTFTAAAAFNLKNSEFKPEKREMGKKFSALRMLLTDHFGVYGAFDISEKLVKLCETNFLNEADITEMILRLLPWEKLDNREQREQAVLRACRRAGVAMTEKHVKAFCDICAVFDPTITNYTLVGKYMICHNKEKKDARKRHRRLYSSLNKKYNSRNRKEGGRAHSWALLSLKKRCVVEEQEAQQECADILNKIFEQLAKKNKKKSLGDYRREFDDLHSQFIKDYGETKLYRVSRFLFEKPKYDIINDVPAEGSSNMTRDKFFRDVVFADSQDGSHSFKSDYESIVNFNTGSTANEISLEKLFFEPEFWQILPAFLNYARATVASRTKKLNREHFKYKASVLISAKLIMLATEGARNIMSDENAPNITIEQLIEANKAESQKFYTINDDAEMANFKDIVNTLKNCDSEMGAECEKEDGRIIADDVEIDAYTADVYRKLMLSKNPRTAVSEVLYSAATALGCKLMEQLFAAQELLLNMERAEEQKAKTLAKKSNAKKTATKTEKKTGDSQDEDVDEEISKLEKNTFGYAALTIERFIVRNLSGELFDVLKDESVSVDNEFIPDSAFGFIDGAQCISMKFEGMKTFVKENAAKPLITVKTLVTYSNNKDLNNEGDLIKKVFAVCNERVPGAIVAHITNYNEFIEEVKANIKPVHVLHFDVLDTSHTVWKEDKRLFEAVTTVLVLPADGNAIDDNYKDIASEVAYNFNGEYAKKKGFFVTETLIDDKDEKYLVKNTRKVKYKEKKGKNGNIKEYEEEEIIRITLRKPLDKFVWGYKKFEHKKLGVKNEGGEE